MVRIAVARLELTPVIPTFAKIAVSHANKAESKAYPPHEFYYLVIQQLLFLFINLIIFIQYP